jgi:hypothetical protein
MRKADFDVAWQQGRVAQLSKLAVKKIELRVGANLFAVDVNSRISAFIGRNGVGKTGFLSNLAATLNGSSLPSPRNCINEIRGFFRGQEFSVSPGKAAPNGLYAEVIDSSSDVHKVRAYLLSQKNLDEFIVQYEANRPNANALGVYRYVTGLPYDSIEVRELEAPVAPMVAETKSDQDDLVFPFFEVKAGNVSYNSLTMGFGELCACHCIWKLLRTPQGRIILFDEPDAHLSPASRRAFVDALAFIAHQKKLWIGFSTHSMELLEPLLDNEVFLVSASAVGASSRLEVISHRRQAVRELGLSQVRTLLISVEDVDAQAVVWALIHRWAPMIASSVDVVIVDDGAEQVKNFVQLFPRRSRICKAIAVLDGDKRPTEAPKNLATSETVSAMLEEKKKIPSNLFLPSDKDPIWAGRELLMVDSSSFAAQLGVAHEAVRTALEKGKHIDHHDFLAYLVDELNLEGRTVHDVRYALVNFWLGDATVATEAQQVARDLAVFLDQDVVP